MRSAIGLHTMVSARSGGTSSTSSSMSNSDALAFDVLARKLVNCSLSLLPRLHHDKTEATGLLGVGVNHDLNLGNLANLAEQIFERTLGNGTRQATDVKVITLVGSVRVITASPISPLRGPGRTPTSIPSWTPGIVTSSFTSRRALPSVGIDRSAIGSRGILPDCRTRVSRQSSRVRRYIYG